MVFQLFDPVLRTASEAIFRERPEQLSLLQVQVKEYALITSDQFLVALSQSPTLIATGLVLSQGDSTTFSLLNKLVLEVKRVMEELKKKEKRKTTK